MPRSRILKTAATESLAWTVEKTRWPVIEARIAVRAVSSSLTSPTSMTSGSCLRTDLRIVPNPWRSEIGIWVQLSSSYSTGSSMVTTFRWFLSMNLRQL